MARIRTIKPEFFRHGGLFDAEQETGLPLRIAFAGLWSACDRDGRFQWKPRELKLDALPFDTVDFSRVLDALRTRGFVLKYVIDGVAYGFIPSWDRHQVINNREAASALPAPDENSIESVTSTREARVDDASATPLVQLAGEGKGKEGKGREGKSPSDAPAPQPPTFDAKATPLREGVDATHLKDWIKARKSPLTETAWLGLRVEAAKAGISAAEAVRICAVKGWRGFNLTWDWRSVCVEHPDPEKTVVAAQRAATDAEAMRLLGFDQQEVFDA